MIIIVRQYSKSKLVWYFVYRLKKKKQQKKTHADERIVS